MRGYFLCLSCLELHKMYTKELDTGIPDCNDFIFIKGHNKFGSCIWGGGMSYTTFGAWGRLDEGDKILKCYTFDLFTISFNIHQPRYILISGYYT